MKSNTVTVKKMKKPPVGQRLSRQKKLFLRDWQLHLLILLPIVYILIFHYYPMYGLQIAFRNFTPKGGVTGSEWVGWKWFEKFMTNVNFRKIVWNTVALSLMDIAIGFPLPIILALMLNTLTNEKFKKFVQNTTYIPHFISIVVLVAMFQSVFNPFNGLYGALYRLFGGVGKPEDIRGLSDTFRWVYVLTGVWQNLGWNTIIYTASLAGVSADQHEAAEIDGASRLQRIFYVDIPAILPTICIMLILRCGSVMSVGFAKVYLMQTPLNLPVSEVISTYVYKVGMGKPSDYSYGAAVGLFNSVVNCTFVVFVNWLTKKLSSDDVSLF